MAFDLFNVDGDGYLDQFKKSLNFDSTMGNHNTREKNRENLNEISSEHRMEVMESVGLPVESNIAEGGVSYFVEIEKSKSTEKLPAQPPRLLRRPRLASTAGYDYTEEEQQLMSEIESEHRQNIIKAARNSYKRYAGGRTFQAKLEDFRRRRGQIDQRKAEKHQQKLEREEAARRRAEEIRQMKALHVYSRQLGYDGPMGSEKYTS